MYGGLQTDTDQLCQALMQRGHEVGVLCGIADPFLTGWKLHIRKRIDEKLYGFKALRDCGLGYPIWRAWFPWEAVKYVAKQQMPDVIIVLSVYAVRMALAAKQTKIPILMRLLDVEFHQHGGRFEDLHNIPCIANSHFTAVKYRDAYGVNPSVTYPFICAQRYKTESTRETVTFINPTPAKGLDIALGVARLCPDIPFSFVESWPLCVEVRQQLNQMLPTLPNITFMPPQSDMRKVYGKCKLLLAPSRWNEAYGRVATEAQISGMPVVASARGGLPEAVGAGGILLDPDQPVADWAAAVRKLWENHQYYTELSAAALTHAQRREIGFDYQMEAWERAMLAARGIKASARQ
jgi:glycosyltransferase involved in cell wall biosynthesis